MTPLEKLVNDRLTELGDRSGPLSFRRAAERAGRDRSGRLLISHQMLQLIANGKGSKRYSPRVLQGVALAIDVPLSQVLEAAEQEPRETEFRLPKKAAKLTQADRKAVEALVNALLDAHERSNVPE